MKGSSPIESSASEQQLSVGKDVKSEQEKSRRLLEEKKSDSAYAGKQDA